MAEISINEKKLLNKTFLAKSFFARLKGLMFRVEMGGIDGMVIEQCNSIHTFFMKFPIDVYFLNKKNEVVKINLNMGPWRMTFPKIGAVKVLETYTGKISEKIEIGDKVEIKCLS